MKIKILGLALLLMLGSLAALYGQNNALEFNSQTPYNDYIDIGNNVYNQLFAGADGFSFEGWINPASLLDSGSLRNRIINLQISNGAVALFVGLTQNGKLEIGARSGPTDSYQNVLSSVPVVTANSWYHIAAVVNFASGSQSIRGYVNGVEVAANTSPAFANTSYVPGPGNRDIIGLHPSTLPSFSDQYIGLMDELRIWKYARTPAEIQDDMFSELELPRDRLIGYWQFNETSGSVAYDSSPSGKNGTLVNFPVDPWTGINLYFDPEESYLEYGETVTLDVWAENLLWYDPLRGFEMQVNYDTDYLTATAADFTEGTFLSSFAVPQGTQFYVRGEDGAWIVSCAILSVPPGTWDEPFGASGDGILFSVNLTALQRPSCYTAIPVTLTDITLRNEINHPLYPDSVKGADIYVKPTLVIPLRTGWNLISSWVIPQDMTIEAVFLELKDAGYLVKVQDELGNAYEAVSGGSWINNIGNYAMTEGYYVRVNTDCDLIIKGSCIILPMTVQLYAGWNIIPYPYIVDTGALAFLQANMDTNYLLKVQDEAGNAIEPISGGSWIDNIGDFEETEGYYIRVSQDTTLNFPLP